MSSARRFIVIFINYVVIFLVLGFSFFLVTLLSSNKEQYEKSDALLSFLFSMGIVVVNFILGFIIDFSTKF